MTPGRAPPAKHRRVLVLSTLWPNAANPRFGTFVASSIAALQRETHWQPVVVNPIGIPPFAPGRRRAAEFAARTEFEDPALDGIEVDRPLFRTLPGPGARFNPAAIAKAVLPLARDCHARASFDVVDAQFFWPDGPAAAQIADALGLPLSIKARGSDIIYWSERGFALAAMREAARRATGMLAVSQALRGEMIARGFPGERIVVHLTGLDRDRFRPLDHAGLRATLAASLGLPLRNGEPLIACVGALVAHKGQALLLEALAGLPEARLLLVGTGPDEAGLRALAERLGMAGRVHFLGALDHDTLPLVLSASDVMALASAREGLANAWVEALACGTPIVITDVGGAREIVTRPDVGAIVAPTAAGLREGITRMLANRAAPLEVAASVAAFDWTEHAAALARHYDALAEAGRVAAPVPVP